MRHHKNDEVNKLMRTPRGTKRKPKRVSGEKQRALYGSPIPKNWKRYGG